MAQPRAFLRGLPPAEGARCGAAYPAGGRGFPEASGAQRPGGPACPGGPHFSREMGRKGPGLRPWTPTFKARRFHSLVLAVVSHCSDGGAISPPSAYPDLGIFFRKILLAYFFLENASQIGLSIPEEIAPSNGSGTTIPKPASGERAAIKVRVQGGALVFFPPTFFKESWAPPPESAGTHLAGANLRWS